MSKNPESKRNSGVHYESYQEDMSTSNQNLFSRIRICDEGETEQEPPSNNFIFGVMTTPPPIRQIESFELNQVSLDQDLVLLEFS